MVHSFSVTMCPDETSISKRHAEHGKSHIRNRSPGYGPAGSPPLRVEAFEAFPWRFLVAIRRSLLPMLELWHSADGCSFVHRRRPRKVSRGAGREPMHAFGGDSFRDVWRVAAQTVRRFAVADTIAQLSARVQSSARRGHVDKMIIGRVKVRCRQACPRQATCALHW